MAIPGLRLDPFPAYNFYIWLIDSSSALASLNTALNLVPITGFSECSGLEGTLQVEEYSEGGENRFIHKFPTRMTYSNLVLRRGVTVSEDLWNWHFDYVKGTGKRRDGLIMMRNELQIPVKIWLFKEGVPLRWTGPTLNASQNAIAIESLEIMHHGLELVSAGSLLNQGLGAVFPA
jgi:phage tail-like protein